MGSIRYDLPFLTTENYLMARSRMLSFNVSRPFAATLSLTFLAVALTGCDSGTQEPDAPVAEATEYSAPAADDGAEPRAAAAAADNMAALPEGFEAAMPSNFPSNIPVFPGATPTLGRGGNLDGSERSGVQLSADASPTEVLSYYESELASNGWTIDESTGMSIAATNGDSEMMLFVSPSATGGSEVYMITEQNEN